MAAAAGVEGEGVGAGVVIRALAWLGPHEIEDGLDAVFQLRQQRGQRRLAATRLGQRHADMLWKALAVEGSWLYLFVLLKFQSTIDRRMGRCG